jgi:hypothetical protein
LGNRIAAGRWGKNLLVSPFFELTPDKSDYRKLRAEVTGGSPRNSEKATGRRLDATGVASPGCLYLQLTYQFYSPSSNDISTPAK